LSISCTLAVCAGGKTGYYCDTGIVSSGSTSTLTGTLVKGAMAIYSIPISGIAISLSFLVSNQTSGGLLIRYGAPPSSHLNIYDIWIPANKMNSSLSPSWLLPAQTTFYFAFVGGNYGFNYSVTVTNVMCNSFQDNLTGAVCKTHPYSYVMCDGGFIECSYPTANIIQTITYPVPANSLGDSWSYYAFQLQVPNCAMLTLSVNCSGQSCVFIKAVFNPSIIPMNVYNDAGQQVYLEDAYSYVSSFTSVVNSTTLNLIYPPVGQYYLGIYAMETNLTSFNMSFSINLLTDNNIYDVTVQPDNVDFDGAMFYEFYTDVIPTYNPKPSNIINPNHISTTTYDILLAVFMTIPFVLMLVVVILFGGLIALSILRKRQQNRANLDDYAPL